MSEFKRLLPLTSTKLERDLEQVMAQSFAIGERDLRKLKSPQQIPVQWLPWLAWERRVSYWIDSWSITTQRDVVDASIAVHRMKGTLRSVQLAIAAIGVDAAITVDRRDPGYVPHTFRVVVDSDDCLPSMATVADMHYGIASAKPARCSYGIAWHHEQSIMPFSMRMGASLKMQVSEPVDVTSYRWRDIASLLLKRGISFHCIKQEAAAWQPY